MVRELIIIAAEEAGDAVRAITEEEEEAALQD